MPNQPSDPIISEVRAVRDAHAARFGYDIAAIFRNIRKMQDASERKYVRFPARPVDSSITENSTGVDRIGHRTTE